MHPLLYFASIASFIFAIIYTRSKYQHGEGYIAIPRVFLLGIFWIFINNQYWIPSSGIDYWLMLLMSVVVSLVFGFFISLDRVNKENLSVLKELNTWDIEKIAKALELGEKKTYKLIEICRNPEKHL